MPVASTFPCTAVLTHTLGQHTSNDFGVSAGTHLTTSLRRAPLRNHNCPCTDSGVQTPTQHVGTEDQRPCEALSVRADRPDSCLFSLHQMTTGHSSPRYRTQRVTAAVALTSRGSRAVHTCSHTCSDLRPQAPFHQMHVTHSVRPP